MEIAERMQRQTISARNAVYPPALGVNPAVVPVVPSPIEPPTPKGNDCEIIVIGKVHQRYAEHVENSMRQLGLKVDLMFPKSSITVQTFIAHIASTGAAFAAVIKSENEAHQSLSLHVLKCVPKPEEHRNMPLEQAFKLIKDRFNEIRRVEFAVIAPEFLKTINLMTTRHHMTDAEYLYLHHYIESRWKQQKLIEGREDYDPGLGISSISQIQSKLVKALGLDGN